MSLLLNHQEALLVNTKQLTRSGHSHKGRSFGRLVGHAVARHAVALLLVDVAGTARLEVVLDDLELALACRVHDVAATVLRLAALRQVEDLGLVLHVLEHLRVAAGLARAIEYNRIEPGHHQTRFLVGLEAKGLPLIRVGLVAAAHPHHVPSTVGVEFLAILLAQNVH